LQVEVNLYATLRRKIRRGKRFPLKVDVPGGTDVEGLLRGLKISPSETKIIVLNGRHATLTSKLHDGDRLDVFPPLAGG